MKKLSILLALVLCMMLAFGAQAVEAVPGDTVTIPVSISADNAYFIGLTVKYDTAIFDYVSISCTGPNAQANGNTMMMYTIDSAIPSGQVGSITLKVKDGVKSGTYAVTVAVTGAYDFDENDVSCKASGGSVTVIGAACTHDKADFKVIKEADCVNAGERQIVCTECGEVLGTETIEKLGHDFGEYVLTKAADCTNAGEETAKCSRCDAKETREVKALGHSFGVYTETKAANCTDKGEETAKCVRCDVTDTKEIPALGHDLGDYTVTKPATCTDKGEETAKCSRCDLASVSDIPALGHDFGKWTETKPATCTDKGEEASKCTRCDVAETREIAALGHDFAAYTETKPATCTDKGEETAKCTRCDVTDSKEIAALGHDFGAYTVTKPATCTDKGEETAKCSRCDVVDTREIAALGHAFGAWTVEVEATCDADGLEARVCANCGLREEKVIAALGHNAVWKTVKPATGKEDGLKQKICKRCNVVLEEQVIPMLKTTYKTACTAGIKVSELTDLFDKNDAWKMVTPIDLTIEGTTRYPLIAGNVYEIGYVEVTIAEGKMTAELVVEAKSAAMYTSALVLFSDVSEIKRFTANDYEHYEFPVSITLTDLEADQMYMMVACQLTIDEAKPEPKYYNFKGEEHAALIESLKAIFAEEAIAE